MSHCGDISPFFYYKKDGRQEPLPLFLLTSLSDGGVLRARPAGAGCVARSPCRSAQSSCASLLRLYMFRGVCLRLSLALSSRASLGRVPPPRAALAPVARSAPARLLRSALGARFACALHLAPRRAFARLRLCARSVLSRAVAHASGAHTPPCGRLFPALRAPSAVSLWLSSFPPYPRLSPSGERSAERISLIVFCCLSVMLRMFLIVS